MADFANGSPHVAPHRQVGVWQAISVCVGMVIGAGIFKSPALVAANVDSELAMLLAWAFGGAMSLAGALCFAEMAAAFPDPGGDYHFLRRALGARVGFLFAWSRFAVIHTGSLAMLAFVLGDYLAELANLGMYGSPLAAMLAIVVLAAVNLAGLRTGMGTQVGLMVVVFAGLIAVGLAGIAIAVQGALPVAPAGGGRASTVAASARHWCSCSSPTGDGATRPRCRRRCAIRDAASRGHSSPAWRS